TCWPPFQYVPVILRAVPSCVTVQYSSKRRPAPPFHVPTSFSSSCAFTLGLAGSLPGVLAAVLVSSATRAKYRTVFCPLLVTALETSVSPSRLSVTSSLSSQLFAGFLVNLRWKASRPPTSATPSPTYVPTTPPFFSTVPLTDHWPASWAIRRVRSKPAPLPFVFQVPANFEPGSPDRSNGTAPRNSPRERLQATTR